MQRLEEDMERDRHLMKIRQNIAHKRLTKKSNKKSNKSQKSNKSNKSNKSKNHVHQHSQHSQRTSPNVPPRPPHKNNASRKKQSSGGVHPFLQSASDFSNRVHKTKAKRKEKRRRSSKGIMDDFSAEYGGRNKRNDRGGDTSELIESALREGEHLLYKDDDYQTYQTSPLSEDSTLGTSLLEYESRRLTRLVPEIDSVLGYQEEPQ